jgi:TP901-1 family phage major tail protein
MAAKSGRSLIISRGDDQSPQTFTRISGGREESFTINNELIDITDKSDAGWRRYLEGVAGLKSVSVSVSGVMVDDTLINDALNQTKRDYQIDVDGEGVFEGGFMIASYEASGAHQDAITHTITLESTGPITYTPDA